MLPILHLNGCKFANPTILARRHNTDASPVEYVQRISGARVLESKAREHEIYAVVLPYSVAEKFVNH